MLYCKICAASLRTVGGRCSNGCCPACHLRYCSPADHTIDVEVARQRQAADLVAELANRREPLEPKPEAS